VEGLFHTEPVHQVSPVFFERFKTRLVERDTAKDAVVYRVRIE
jgi:hypothetical protein